MAIRTPADLRRPDVLFRAINWRPLARASALQWIKGNQLSFHVEYDRHAVWWRAEVDVLDVLCMYNVDFHGSPMRQGARFVDVARKADLRPDDRQARAVIYIARDQQAYIADGNHRVGSAILHRNVQWVDAILVPVPEAGWDHDHPA